MKYKELKGIKEEVEKEEGASSGWGKMEKKSADEEKMEAI